MKASQLNVFDWFFIDGEAMQVMPTLIDHVFSNPNQAVDIKPIPLTPDILLANGFKDFSIRNTVQYKLWKSPEEIIWATVDGMYFKIYTVVAKGTFNDILIEHVHELQHLLREAGFIDMADDWKLEKGGAQ